MNSERSDEPAQPGFYRLAWGFYLLLALGGVVWLGTTQGSIQAPVFIDSDHWWQDLLLGLAAASVLLLSWRVAQLFLTPVQELERQLGKMLSGIAPNDVLPLALLSGFAEEFFFRGAMQMAWGWPWTTAIFALLHTGRQRIFLLWTAFAALAGLLFALLTEWRGNLLPAILAHVLVNAINLRRVLRQASLD